jgi:putative resolvase
MEVLLRIGEAATRLGLNVATLQRWDQQGKIRIARTLGGKRRVPLSEVQRLMGENERRAPLPYGRVSSHGQKEDIERRKERLLRAFPGAGLHTDIRSGLKFDRPRFLAVLKAVQERSVSLLWSRTRTDSPDPGWICSVRCLPPTGRL